MFLHSLRMVAPYQARGLLGLEARGIAKLSIAEQDLLSVHLTGDAMRCSKACTEVSQHRESGSASDDIRGQDPSP